MDLPIKASNTPIAVMLKKGKKYAWCSCGLSINQPFCDGSHASTSMRPLIFEATEDGEKYLCRCKQTKNAPFCDGSHK